MQLDELDQGHHIVWGALTDDDQNRLALIARRTGRPALPHDLASSITQATQSLDIDGRVVPAVLTPSAQDGAAALTASFAAWIRQHEPG
jgi:hypothetical protein